MYIYIKRTFITYGSSYLGLSCLVQIGVFSCVCAEQHQTPPTRLWHRRQPEALWGWTVWLRPEEGSIRPLEREDSFCLFAPSSSCCTGSITRATKSQLFFDILDPGQLRDGFLDPQRSETSGGVGVPALSHHFAHNTHRLEKRSKYHLMWTTG